VSTAPAGTPASPPSRTADARQPEPRKPKLLDRLREALRARHCSPRTEQTYRHWVKRFISFYKVRHPAEMAEPEINAFLTQLAVRETVSASTQTQALSALLFLYRHVIGRDVGDLGKVIRCHALTRGRLRYTNRTRTLGP
jgi:site-specific recombinase XerD